MPRDGNGNYTRPNSPVQSNTTIEAAEYNSTITDIEQALTESLSREGDGGMNTTLFFEDGLVGSPGISFENDPDTGFYRSASGVTIYVANAANTVRFGNSGDGGLGVYRDSAWQDVLDAGTDQGVGGVLTFNTSPAFPQVVTFQSNTNFDAAVRIANDAILQFRNNADDAWLNALTVDTSDLILLGRTGGNVRLRGTEIQLNAPVRVQNSNNVTLTNDSGIYIEESGGSPALAIYMGTADVMLIGETSRNTQIRGNTVRFTGSGDVRLSDGIALQVYDGASGYVDALFGNGTSFLDIGNNILRTRIMSANRVLLNDDGLEMVNNTGLYMRTVGGTPYRILNFNTSNVIRFGQSAYGMEIAAFNVVFEGTTTFDDNITVSLGNQILMEGAAIAFEDSTSTLRTCINLNQITDEFQVGSSSFSELQLRGAEVTLNTADAAQSRNVSHYATYDSSRQNSSFTLVAADEGRTILWESSGTPFTNHRTITVPPDSSVSFPLGTRIEIHRKNTTGWDSTIAAGSGVTIEGDLVMGGSTHHKIELVKVASDTWICSMIDTQI